MPSLGKISNFKVRSLIKNGLISDMNGCWEHVTYTVKKKYSRNYFSKQGSVSTCKRDTEKRFLLKISILLKHTYLKFGVESSIFCVTLLCRKNGNCNFNGGLIQ